MIIRRYTNLSTYIDALTQVRAWLSLRERVLAMTEELRFHGSIQEVAVNRTGRTWFALFCVEDGQDPPPVKDGPIVGVDVGVGTMAVCSDGMKVANSNALGSALTELRRIDEAIARSRNVYGKSNHSNRREQLYAKKRRIHARVSTCGTTTITRRRR